MSRNQYKKMGDFSKESETRTMMKAALENPEPIQHEEVPNEPIHSVPVEDEVPQTVTRSAAPPSNDKPSNKKWWIIGIVVFIVALLGAIWCFFSDSIMKLVNGSPAHSKKSKKHAHVEAVVEVPEVEVPEVKLPIPLEVDMPISGGHDDQFWQ